MIKKCIIILITSLFFVGCAERGQPQVPQKIIEGNATVYEKDTTIPTLVVRANNTDTLENKVSGGLILLIGILILL